MLIDIDANRAKSLVWSMKNHLAQAGYNVPNTALLEALTQGLGASNYRTLKAAPSTEPENRSPSYAEQARRLLKGDREAAVRFETLFRRDGKNTQSVLMYLTAGDIETILEAGDKVKDGSFNFVSVQTPRLEYESGVFTPEPSGLRVTRPGEVRFQVYRDSSPWHSHVKPWPIATMLDDLKLRTPGTIIDAGASQGDACDEDDVEGLPLPTEDGTPSEKPTYHALFLEGKTVMVENTSPLNRRRTTDADMTGDMPPRLRRSESAARSGIPSHSVTTVAPWYAQFEKDATFVHWRNTFEAEATREGWGLFAAEGAAKPGVPPFLLQRDDEQDLFIDDVDAWAHILARAAKDTGSAAFAVLQLIAPAHETEIRRAVAKKYQHE